MARTRIQQGVAGLATIAVFAGVVLIWGSSQQGTTEAQAEQAPPRERPAAKPIAMPTNLAALDIALGLKDSEPGAWRGDIQVSEGRITSFEIIGGGPNKRVDGNRFTARSIRQMRNMQQVIVGPVLRIGLEAPQTATVTVETDKGKFSFKLEELAPGTAAKTFLDGQASVEELEGAVRLTGRETEDDYPALAKGPDGTAWLAYVEYQPGKPLINERVLAGGFEALVPTGNGDQVRLMRFDGKTWYPPEDVTGPGIEVFRPAVAVDGKGNVVVAWTQYVDNDWEVFYRRYTPAAKPGELGSWSAVARVTRSPGSDSYLVSTTDSAGVVWLAWQGWRNDNFDIMLTALADDHPWRVPRPVASSPANEWCPALAADSKGNVYVAYDTYERGNYDVRLCVAGRGDPRTVVVADSARFEARPSVVCDGKDRLWIAYEEGDEQWGKDFSTQQFRRIGLGGNPGNGLYLARTIKVKCLADGKLMQPAGDLQAVFKSTPQRRQSLPRIGVDATAGLWLLYRQHPGPGQQGEVWNSYAVRYDGKAWSAPRRLGYSAELLDNRPGLVGFGPGLLTVYTGDGRLRTQNRDQNDLFAALLVASGPAQEVQFADNEARPDAKLAAVHPDEAAAVARMRGYTIDHAGKKLHLIRGEFHRHTEYSSHGDIDGLLEDSWRYSLDPGNMDWMGNGDHDNGFGHEYQWWKIQKICDLFHNPPRFVAAMTYERSVVFPNGHRNVMMPRRGIRPLPRGELPGTPEKGTPDTKILYAYLKHFGGICSSHTSGTNMGTDWRDNDPTVEPVVEIYQGHRHNYEHFGAPRSATEDTHIGGYRPAGFVWNALEKGYRLGFQSSSDHVSTHMSYAVVLAEQNSRQALIDAFKKRHSYAATDNILVDVRSGEHLMGDEFTTSKRPTLEITVIGAGPIAKLHVIKDNKYVYSTEPKAAEVKNLRYTDMDAKEGKTSYYYVRVEQQDGNLAWASPMWITYKP